MPGPVLECLLCDKRCRLGPDQRGDCRVRVNLDGKLVSLVYGKVCSTHVDPIEKKPMFHFLPGTTAYSIATAGCNLHCAFCQNWEISQLDPEDARAVDLPPDRLVAAALAAHCPTIAYTYTDPVVFYEYALDACREARAAGLRNVLVTAGFIREEPLTELAKVVDGANVDIKSMSDRFYREVCGGRLQPVLNAVRQLKRAGVVVEITNLLVPTRNDDAEGLKRLCDWLLTQCGPETPLHFSRFFPMYKMQNLPPTPVATLREAYRIATSMGLHHVYIGNVHAEIGEATTCPGCKRTIVERTGYVLDSYHVKDGQCAFCGTAIYGLWT
jgi:pyruvate formate lyase activating enzyme